MAKIKAFEFTVEGPHDFPVDMLRYDGCWPRTSEDAVAITRDVRDGKLHRVTLISHHRPPTVARWKSFGWDVVEQRPYTIDM